MANEKQRYISTSFWDDNWIQSLNPSEKLLYLYLLMNPLTNIAGVYEISVRRMAFDTGFNDDTINLILKRFENDKRIYHYKGYIIIKNYPKHQKYKQRPTIAVGIENIINHLPQYIQKYMVSIGYAYDIHSLCNYSDSDSDSDSDLDSKAKPPKAKHEKTGRPMNLTRYTNLCTDYGAGIVDDYIQRVADWSDSKSKHVADYAAAAANWLKRDNVKPLTSCPDGITLAKPLTLED